VVERIPTRDHPLHRRGQHGLSRVDLAGDADGRRAHQLPAAVVANNYLNQRSRAKRVKISKSSTPQDAPVWIEEYVKKGLDPDALRYYLTAQAPETARTAFDPDDFVTRNNSELVAALGNFVNRTLTFAQKYFDGQVPDAAAQTDADGKHIAAGEAALAKVGEAPRAHRFRGGLEEMMAYARLCNEYFSERAPWASRKTDMADCAATIATCIHAVHYLAMA
jgi:methionyl-tRNA synthetase